MKQISRHGSYGVVLQDDKILLTLKKSGPYQGLWGLPGGGIEFGEAPEEALKREMLEETSLDIGKLELLNSLSVTGKHKKNGESFQFHHIGLIYKIVDWKENPQAIPEEENRWTPLVNINLQELTPFASQTVSRLPKYNYWRPISAIRGKVIGLAKHENRLLVCEVLADDGGLKGWCPVGGGIEFGESAEEALAREIQEELGSDIIITGEPVVCENFFEHQGAKGHEIIFAFPIQLEKKELYAKKRFQITESRGCLLWVEWVPIQLFEQGQAILFPSVLVNKVGSLDIIAR